MDFPNIKTLRCLAEGDPSKYSQISIIQSYTRQDKTFLKKVNIFSKNILLKIHLRLFVSRFKDKSQGCKVKR